MSLIEIINIMKKIITFMNGEGLFYNISRVIEEKENLDYKL